MTIAEIIDQYPEIMSSLLLLKKGVENFSDDYKTLKDLLKINEANLKELGDDIPTFLRWEDILEVQGFIYDYIDNDLEDFLLSTLESKMEEWNRIYIKTFYPG